ncbi:MAG: TonB family protein [Bacteroidota bacterium]
MELPRLTVLNERFAIRKVLGDLGPFEATYLAWDLENEEQVIVREYLPVGMAKRDEKGVGLLPKSPDFEEQYQYGLEKIVKEAALCVRIDHPNVVKEREYFRENGTVYRILDYHAGASLAYVLEQQGGKVSPRTAVTILMPLMDGVKAGHAQGLVHGAISPDKIYLTKSGRPMLLSFKTTHLLLAQKTQNLVSFQQPGFSPPEQYTPRGKHGPWSDVYGCGAALYTMLSGGQLPDIPSRLREDQVPALIDQSFDLSLGTRNALKAALDMNITRRPQSIEAFRAMLVDGFDLPGAHVPPPEAPAQKEAFHPRANVAAPPAQPVPEAPVHFGADPVEDPIGVPVARQPLPIEQLQLDPESSGDSGGIAAEFIKDPLADRQGIFEDPGSNSLDFDTGNGSQFEATFSGFTPVAVPSTQLQDSSPAVYDRVTPAVQEEEWEKEPAYAAPRRRTSSGSGGRRIIFFLLFGSSCMLAFLLYTRMQNAEPNTLSNSGYSTALLKGDSLYTLGETEFAADNWDNARSLFERARENYSLALTLGDGDKATLRQRIDDVDGYLDEPITVALDARESLAFISRGDSVMNAADALNVVGDSVEARLLYRQAREEYLKVIDVRPDDSLANARLREATQRMVAPVRVAPAPAPTYQVNAEQERAQRLYLKFKMEGDSAYDINSLVNAKAKFEEALIYKPGDEYALSRISIINQRVRQGQRESQYKDHMSSGFRLKDLGRLEEAKAAFLEALKFNETSQVAQNAIFEVDTLIDQIQKKEEAYLSHKTRGEVLLEKEDYAGALDSFTSALIAKPDDVYASQKVKEINETLSALAKDENQLPEGMVDDNGIYNYTEDAPVLVGGREVLQSRLRYPPKAVEAGIEGRVSVRMIVDETGRMINPQILKGLRHDMDAEVMRVIRGARFEPGRVGGLPVKSWYTLFFEFKLDNE